MMYIDITPQSIASKTKSCDESRGIDISISAVGIVSIDNASMTVSLKMKSLAETPFSKELLKIPRTLKR